MAESSPSYLVEQVGVEILLGIIESHAVDSLETNSSNAKYAETVRLRAQQTKALITNKSGEVKGVVTSWVDDIQPILEVVFNKDLSGHAMGEHREFSPTAFDGIFARICIISTDEIFGPLVALDLVAEDSL